MRPDKASVIVVSYSERPLWAEKWRVQIGEGEDCIHDTTHHTEEDALMMVRVLMRGMLKEPS